MDVFPQKMDEPGKRDQPKVDPEVMEFLQQLARAWRFRGLYTPDHISCVKAREEAYQTLLKVLIRKGELVFAVRAGMLIVEDEPVEVIPASLITLVKDLARRGIESVAIRRGTAPAHLREFIELRAMTPLQIERAGGPAQILAQKCPHIIVNRVIYQRAEARVGGGGEGSRSDQLETMLMIDYLLSRKRDGSGGDLKAEEVMAQIGGAQGTMDVGLIAQLLTKVIQQQIKEGAGQPTETSSGSAGGRAGEPVQELGLGPGVGGGPGAGPGPGGSPGLGPGEGHGPGAGPGPGGRPGRGAGHGAGLGGILERLAELLGASSHEDWDSVKNRLRQVVFALDPEIQNAIMEQRVDPTTINPGEVFAAFGRQVRFRAMIEEYRAGLATKEQIVQIIRSVTEESDERAAWMKLVQAQREQGAPPELCDAIISALQADEAALAAQAEKAVKFAGLTVLVADGNFEYRNGVANALRRMGFTLMEASDGAEAWKWLELGVAHILVMDPVLRGKHGLEILEEMERGESKIPVLLCTEHEEMAHDFIVRRYPNLRFMKKPFKMEDLENTMAELAEAARGSAG